MNGAGPTRSPRAEQARLAVNAPAPVAAAERPRAPTSPRETRAGSTPSSRAHPDGTTLPPPAMEPRGRARLRPARALSGRRAGRRAGRLPAAHRDPLAPVRQCPGLGRLRHRRRHPRRRRASRRGARRRRLGARRALGCAERRAARRAGPRRLDARSGGIYADFARDLPGDDEALLALDPAPPARRGAPGARLRPRDLGRHATAAIATPISASMPRASAISARRSSRARCSRRCSTRSATRPTSSSVWKDGRPLAALLNFYFKGVCQPYWGGGTARGAAAGAPTT